MQSFVKSTVLGVGLLMGVSAVAQAQSVSALPPTSPETAPATTVPLDSTAKTAASLGNTSRWKEDHYTPMPADNDPARHPYSAAHFGPAVN
jgi:hypothetical protein